MSQRGLGMRHTSGAWAYRSGAYPCANCGRQTVPGKNQRCRGRCHACYQFWRTHGTPRPTRLYAPVGPLERLCVQCGYPRYLTGRGQAFGLCRGCYVKRWRRRRKEAA
jgi:hypothetical protein